MKKILGFSFILCTLIWVTVACSNSPTYSGSGATPTPTPNTSNTGIGATVSGGNYFFSPSTVTINHGQSVVWDNSLTAGGHTVTLDSFSGTSGSTGTTTTSFPVTILFPTAGTYYYHCGVSGHSGCGTATYGVCGGGNGMIGSVVVN
jgi:plastocyanin